jgi:hypothetical protein
MTRYFVAVFGDPIEGRDKVESGVYQAGPGYPKFRAAREDMMLLYCTGDYGVSTGQYVDYRKSVVGLGEVIRADEKKVEYKWQPLTRPLPRQAFLPGFIAEDQKPMNELGITARRLFEIDTQSYKSVIALPEAIEK